MSKARADGLPEIREKPAGAIDSATNEVKAHLQNLAGKNVSAEYMADLMFWALGRATYYWHYCPNDKMLSAQEIATVTLLLFGGLEGFEKSTKGITKAVLQAERKYEFLPTNGPAIICNCTILSALLIEYARHTHNPLGMADNPDGTSQTWTIYNKKPYLREFSSQAIVALLAHGAEMPTGKLIHDYNWIDIILGASCEPGEKILIFTMVFARLKENGAYKAKYKQDFHDSLNLMLGEFASRSRYIETKLSDANRSFILDSVLQLYPEFLEEELLGKLLTLNYGKMSWDGVNYYFKVIVDNIKKLPSAKRIAAVNSGSPPPLVTLVKAITNSWQTPEAIEELLDLGASQIIGAAADAEEQHEDNAWGVIVSEFACKNGAPVEQVARDSLLKLMSLLKKPEYRKITEQHVNDTNKAGTTLLFQVLSNIHEYNNQDSMVLQAQEIVMADNSLIIDWFLTCGADISLLPKSNPQGVNPIVSICSHRILREKHLISVLEKASPELWADQVGQDKADADEEPRKNRATLELILRDYCVDPDNYKLTYEGGEYKRTYERKTWDADAVKIVNLYLANSPNKTTARELCKIAENPDNSPHYLEVVKILVDTALKGPAIGKFIYRRLFDSLLKGGDTTVLEQLLSKRPDLAKPVLLNYLIESFKAELSNITHRVPLGSMELEGDKYQPRKLRIEKVKNISDALLQCLNCLKKHGIDTQKLDQPDSDSTSTILFKWSIANYLHYADVASAASTIQKFRNAGHGTADSVTVDVTTTVHSFNDNPHDKRHHVSTLLDEGLAGLDAPLVELTLKQGATISFIAQDKGRNNFAALILNTLKKSQNIELPTRFLAEYLSKTADLLELIKQQPGSDKCDCINNEFISYNGSELNLFGVLCLSSNFNTQQRAIFPIKKQTKMLETLLDLGLDAKSEGNAIHEILTQNRKLGLQIVEVLEERGIELETIEAKPKREKPDSKTHTKDQKDKTEQAAFKLSETVKKVRSDIQNEEDERRLKAGLLGSGVVAVAGNIGAIPFALSAAHIIDVSTPKIPLLPQISPNIAMASLGIAVTGLALGIMVGHGRDPYTGALSGALTVVLGEAAIIVVEYCLPLAFTNLSAGQIQLAIGATYAAVVILSAVIAGLLGSIDEGKSR